MVDNIDQLKEFIDKESSMDDDSKISWVIEDNFLKFIPMNVDKEAISAKKMMYQVLEYTQELMKIA